MAAVAQEARAQSFVLDARTYFTFSGPVELPGVTLPAASYVFRFVDESTGRRVMEVRAKDKPRKVYGLFVTAMAERRSVSDHAEVRLMEVPAGTTPAIRSWWYPGNSTGREFIYPKDQARRLAFASRTKVLSTTGDNVSASDLQTTPLTYASPIAEE